MKKILLLTFLGSLLCFPTFSQTLLRGKEAAAEVSRAELIRYKEGYSLPNYVKFNKGQEISFGEFFSWFKRQFPFSENTEFRLKNIETDPLGYQHFRYLQYLDGYEMKFTMLLVHVKNGKVESFNGVYVPTKKLSTRASISQEAARNFVAGKYQDYRIEEEHKKTLWAPLSLEKIEDTKYVLAHSIVIERPSPYDRAEILIDATTGKELYYYPLSLHIDSVGTVVTKYSGTFQMTADYVGPNNFRLRESGRGNGIETYNMQQQTNYSNAIDFTDTDNYWDNFNANYDEVAGDVHWGTEKFYDYLLDSLNRNSIDNNGYKLQSYVHYDQNWSNASWNGYNMRYGDGNGNPLTTLDIVAHELTHGLTDYTCNLIYYMESGALNESFSDIFGAVIEWYATPNKGDWYMGEDRGGYMRSMINPKDAGDPDTYLGINWYAGQGDNGGVHTNSGVQNHWFYILSDGKQGTNDYGNSYNVTGIGVFKAARIAYRNMSVYLFPSANHDDAAFYAALAATDLYGPCSPELEATVNAWYAVGVGKPYSAAVVADFDNSFGVSCSTPFTVTFYNKSMNANNFTWDFGDGNTSNQTNPTHIYNTPGTYNVKLISDGGSCGSDTIVKTQIIKIGSQFPCGYTIGNPRTECKGYLFDDGGANDNYSNNSYTTTMLNLSNAAGVKLKFLEFAFEAGYDSLFILAQRNGNWVSVGRYSGFTLPNNGNEIVLSDTSLLIIQYTDPGVTEKGFVLYWECISKSTPPIADFSPAPAVTCNGTLQFTDNSINASAWNWNFGDGNSSNQQNPQHTYNQPGIYQVTLIASNAYGSDTAINTFVKIYQTDKSILQGDTLLCPGDSTVLKLPEPSPTTVTQWFSDPLGNNVISDSASLHLNNLQQDTTVYFYQKHTEDYFFAAKDKNIGLGSYFQYSGKGLVFDVAQTCTLKSVKVYAINAGTRTIRLFGPGGSLITSKTVNIPQGESRVTLDFELTPGNNYEIQASANGNLNLFRNADGANYPYILPNPASGNPVITIKQANLSDPNDAKSYYYFFYDWEVNIIECETPITPVKVSTSCNSAVKNLANYKFSVYPNPTNSFVNISGNLRTIENISLFNALGQEIKLAEIKEETSSLLRLDIETLPTGIYLLKFTLKSGETALYKLSVIE